MPPPMLNKIADLRHGIEEGGLQPRDFLLGRLDVALLLVALALHVLLLLLQRLSAVLDLVKETHTQSYE